MPPLVLIPPYKKLVNTSNASFISSVARAGGSTVTVPRPANVIDGDLLIIVATSSSALNDLPGWSYTAQCSYSWPSYGYNTRLFFRVASSEPSSYTLSNNGGIEIVALCVAYRGPKTLGPVGVFTESLGTYTHKGINVSASGLTLLTYACDRSPSIPSTPSIETMRISQQGTYLGHRLSDEVFNATGATNDRTSYGSNVYKGVAFMFALQ